MEPARIRRLRTTSLALAAVLSLGLVMGFFNTQHPALDSISHFRLHLAVLLGLTAVPLLFASRRRTGVAALAVAAVALFSTSPQSLPGLATVSEAFEGAQGDYRLMQLNLRFDNRTPEEVHALIGRVQPDVITLNELSEKWIDELAKLSKAYPYRLLCDQLAILSRRPFQGITSRRCYGQTLATAGVNFDGREVIVASIHLGWPWPFKQAEQIDEVLPILRSLPGAVILAGDFNAAAWSAAAARVAKVGDMTLVPSAKPTWLPLGAPRWLRPWFGLSLDHIYFKGNIAIKSDRIEGNVGSDHLPTVVDFSIGPPAV